MPIHQPRNSSLVPQRRLRTLEIPSMNTDQLYVYKPAVTRYGNAADADPFTTELIRNALTSAASQMKQTLIRAAYSPIIYEPHDFAVVLYDKPLRLLAQAPALPIFMGTMNFCIEATVEAAGGVESLEPGDVLLYKWTYGTGSEPPAG